ncbi:MAG: hypothetical protein PHD67_10010 [Oscillospiraceae bacterium]|nr:hypothetical protein [Oscillospiraceae bacterium]
MDVLIALLGLLFVWLIFLMGVPWFLGFFLCRIAACWHEEDKIKTYVFISSSSLAALLIPRYMGFNSRIRTNLLFLHNRYYANQYPDRLSLLALIEYCIAGIISIWYGVCITDYFFFQNYDNAMIPLTVTLFMCHAVFFFHTHRLE